MSDSEADSTRKPDLREASAGWAKIGLLSFGGPAAQIALMHKLIVEEKRWLSEQQFLNALNFCMLLPGPEAMQLATYAGWRLHGVIGGLIAGLLFVLPGAVVMLALSILYVTYGHVSFVQAAFLGIKAAVVVIVVEALIRISRRALKSTDMYAIAALAFIGIFFLALPYPLIVLGAGIYGFWRGGVASSDKNEEIITYTDMRTRLWNTGKTAGIWFVIWWFPVFLLVVMKMEPILVQISVFFSKLAVVTFGGAYAVLAYMAQHVVDANQWLSAVEMVDGLGLAETTPGPLILVTQFVGFLAAQKGGGVWLGVWAAIITLWVTFVPCFLWIFTGAPYIEWISSRPRLRASLAAITAAVVGVVLNLSLWFALNVFFAQMEETHFGIFRLFTPELSSLDLQAVSICGLAAILMLGLKTGLVWGLVVCASAGMILGYFV